MTVLMLDAESRMAKPTDVATTMRAVVHERYGRPDVLEVRDVALPMLEDDRVLIRVRASSVNPVEWYGVTGPYFARIGAGLRRPSDPAVGVDVAGRIEAVGKDVTGWKVGDDVFGTGTGAWAEYATAMPAKLASKPEGLSFEDAAAVPVAALTALQALRDHGRVEPGQKVLINGASGGVGTYAIQLARVLGAEVTAVCSSRNVEQAAALGAEHVIDYTRENFTRRGERHDLLLDIAGSRSLGQMRRVLTPDATVVLVGGKMTYRGLGPLPHLGATIIASKLRRQTVKFFVAKIDAEDLAYVAGLITAGSIRSVIDRRYPLADAAAALGYLGEGHARGKVVITV